MNTKKIDRGEMYSLIHQYYHQWLRKRVAVFLQECLEKCKYWAVDEFGEDRAREWLDEMVESWCKDPRDNWLTLVASENVEAYLENFGSEAVVVEDDELRVDRLAYHAIQADVRVCLSRSGFDWKRIEDTAPVALKRLTE